MGNQMSHYGPSHIVAEEKLFHVQVKNTRESLLHRSICALTFLDSDGQIGFGSAILISKNIVLTAAHNIFNQRLRKQNKEFKLMIGVDGVGEQYQQIEEWRYPEQFRNCWLVERLQFDFAVMKLKQSVDFQQFLPLSIPCPQCIWLKQLNIFGYPCAYGNYNLNQEGERLLHQYGLSRISRVVVSDPCLFKIGYRISALPGQNGCPVMMQDAIVAIHVGGEEYYNVGRIFDITLIFIINKWISQLQASPFRLEEVNNCPHKLISRQIQQLHTNRQDFANLVELDLCHNYLDMQDFSYYPCLTKLKLSSNQMRLIDLSFNINLTYLDVSFNRLQKIDLSFNTKIFHLDLRNNLLQGVNLSSNTKLIWLNVSSNKLSKIDLRANINLQSISLEQNELVETDVSKNSKLTWLWLHNNKLNHIYLAISRNVSLRIYTTNYFFSFFDQQSAKCQVLQICEDELAKQKATDIADHWKKIYYSTPWYAIFSKKNPQNRYNCRYSFEIA